MSVEKAVDIDFCKRVIKNSVPLSWAEQVQLRRYFDEIAAANLFIDKYNELILRGFHIEAGALQSQGNRIKHAAQKISDLLNGRMINDSDLEDANFEKLYGSLLRQHRDY